MNKISTTIGIPAYNEEANIGRLVRDLLSQVGNNYILNHIIVFSDGSKDNTVKILKQIDDKLIIIIDNKIRRGKSFAQNQIIGMCESDVLVLLDADIILEDEHFIEKIIAPISNGNADLVASAVTEANPSTLFEKILYVSTKIKNEVYEKFENGNNVYTCRGVARAFSKKLYKKFTFITSIGEDAYSYFYCVANGFNYSFVKDTRVIFRLPANFKDHKNQSMKFFKSQELMKQKFGKELVDSSYKLPKLILINSLIKNFIKYPTLTILYFIVLIFLKLQSFFQTKEATELWDISISSKVINL